MRRRGGGAISQNLEGTGKVPGQKVQVPYNRGKRENGRKERRVSEGEKREEEWGNKKKKRKESCNQEG